MKADGGKVLVEGDDMTALAEQGTIPRVRSEDGRAICFKTRPYLTRSRFMTTWACLYGVWTKPRASWK